ncbi:MAG: ribonuclease E inhibitor RraB [Balneolaceae bacterium]
MQNVFSVHRRGVSRPHRKPVVLTGWISVSFQFLSSDESSLFRLAARLKKQGYLVQLRSVGPVSRRSCRASGWVYVEEAELNHLCLEMIALADRFHVIFDRWD